MSKTSLDELKICLGNDQIIQVSKDSFNALVRGYPPVRIEYKITSEEYLVTEI